MSHATPMHGRLEMVETGSTLQAETSGFDSAMREIQSGNDFPRPGSGWLAAPGERSPEFFATFARVSTAIQTTLRERVPAHYFEDARSFANVKTAYPMLVYQASRPFRAKTRTELCYDVLNPTTLVTFFRTVQPRFRGVLEAANIRLLAESGNDLTGWYEPSRASAILQLVQKWNKSRKCLYVLIRAEGVLVNALIGLAGLGRLAQRQQERRVASFQKRWRFQLRRMYPGMDFTWLASELLDVATQALSAPEELAAEGYKTRRMGGQKGGSDEASEDNCSERSLNLGARFS